MNTSSAFRPTKPRRVDTPKGAVSEQFAQVGGIKMAMNRLGIGQSQAYAFTDPQSEEEISFARMAALTSPTATAGAEFMCFMAGGIFMPVIGRSDCHALELMEIAEQAREHGNAIAVLLTAVNDGTVTDAERQEALPRVDAALRGLAKLRACLLISSDEV